MKHVTILVLWMAAGPLAAQDLPVEVDLSCSEGAASVTLQGEGALLRFSGAEMPMARAVTASGVRLEAIDDPETYVWTKGDDAMLRIAGQDLTECTVAATRQVTDGHWILSTLGNAPVTAPPPEIAFEPEGVLSGSTGCNRFTGTWAMQEGLLEIGPLATTRKACAPEALAQEHAFLEVMSELSDLRFGSDGELVLISNDTVQASATR